MEDVGAVVSRVAGRKEAWASMGVRGKIEIIDMIMDGILHYADVLQEASFVKRNGKLSEAANSISSNASSVEPRIKKTPIKPLGDGTFNIGADGSSCPNAYSLMSERDRKITEAAAKASTFLTNTMLLSNWLSVIRESYDSIEKTGSPPSPASVKPIKSWSKPDGRDFHLVKVGPKGLLFNSLMTGGTMELLVEGPVEQENPLEKEAGLTVVLGAGNFDAPIEVFMSLFIDNRVCIYKPNSLNVALEAPLKKLLAPLIDGGYLDFVNISNDQVRGLLEHQLVDKWYMTGSATTASLILWGQPEPPLPSSNAQPLITKPFVFELGNCTPWIVCPGSWSHRELNWHASEIAAALCFNGGHICVHPQLLITCKNWPQREEFLSQIRKYLKDVRYVGCYYENYREKLTSVKQSLENSGFIFEQFSVPLEVPLSKDSNKATEDFLIFATGLPNDNLFAKIEVFVPACGETAIDSANDFSAFLARAVEYVNEHVYGTLSVAVSAKPQGAHEQEVLEEAIENLNYGAVNVNVDTKLAFAFPSLIWGGAPGASIHSLASGIGIFGNSFCFKRPVKAVIRAPFLNFTHMLFANPTEKNASQMQKLWRRISLAVAHRRSTESWFGLSARVSKIMSAFVANL